VIAVHSDSFQQAKSDMECELGKYIELLLRDHRQKGAGHAA
jgi:hypothetical protein